MDENNPKLLDYSDDEALLGAGLLSLIIADLHGGEYHKNGTSQAVHGNRENLLNEVKETRKIFPSIYPKGYEVAKSFGDIPEKKNKAYSITKDGKIIYIAKDGNNYHTQMIAEYIIKNHNDFSEEDLQIAVNAFKQNRMEDQFVEQIGMRSGISKVRIARKFKSEYGEDMKDVVEVTLPDSILGEGDYKNKLFNAKKAILKMDKNGLLPTSYDEIHIFTPRRLMEIYTINEVYEFSKLKGSPAGLVAYLHMQGKHDQESHGNDVASPSHDVKPKSAKRKKSDGLVKVGEQKFEKNQPVYQVINNGEKIFKDNVFREDGLLLVGLKGEHKGVILYTRPVTSHQDMLNAFDENSSDIDWAHFYTEFNQETGKEQLFIDTYYIGYDSLLGDPSDEEIYDNLHLVQKALVRVGVNPKRMVSILEPRNEFGNRTHFEVKLEELSMDDNLLAELGAGVIALGELSSDGIWYLGVASQE